MAAHGGRATGSSFPRVSADLVAMYADIIATTRYPCCAAKLIRLGVEWKNCDHAHAQIQKKGRSCGYSQSREARLNSACSDATARARMAGARMWIPWRAGPTACAAFWQAWVVTLIECLRRRSSGVHITITPLRQAVRSAWP